MERWNPWRALRATDVELWFAALGGPRGRWTRVGDRDEVLIEETLGRRERREVLAHELVHVERGIGWPDATAATMEREEAIVWLEALDRLVPPADVAAFLARRATTGPVSVAELAEEFDLSDDGAQRVAARWERRDRWRVSGGRCG
ncbi:MAG: hypothetical protein KF906_03300 [Actinobacteria bacterium]|nr:hypothetical protein [Actinomycetota bacterium]